MAPDLPILSFEDVAALRAWLEVNHATSTGIFVRIFKNSSSAISVSFEDVLDEGLCFGWSESARMPGDASSYLQRFTPRKRRGTASARNRRHAARLVQEGRMTPPECWPLDRTHLEGCNSRKATAPGQVQTRLKGG